MPEPFSGLAGGVLLLSFPPAAALIGVGVGIGLLACARSGKTTRRKCTIEVSALGKIEIETERTETAFTFHAGPGYALTIPVDALADEKSTEHAVRLLRYFCAEVFKAQERAAGRKTRPAIGACPHEHPAAQLSFA